MPLKFSMHPLNVISVGRVSIPICHTFTIMSDLPAAAKRQNRNIQNSLLYILSCPNRKRSFSFRSHRVNNRYCSKGPAEHSSSQQGTVFNFKESSFVGHSCELNWFCDLIVPSTIYSWDPDPRQISESKLDFQLLLLFGCGILLCNPCK